MAQNHEMTQAYAPRPYDFRIGIDLGGTKTEIAALAPDGSLIERRRVPTPPLYHDSVAGMANLVLEIERTLGGRGSVGIGIPGVISPATGLVKNANTIALNGNPFDKDIQALLEREVRVENDANCFALSEAADGAGAGHSIVFGVILGTGCGGGIVFDGKVMRGRHHIAGEWGHTPLPWPTPEEYPGRRCWCGRDGCLETWISGKAFEADYVQAGGEALAAPAVVERARAGEGRARAALTRYIDRLGRGLAVVCDLADPAVIVLGGGMSNVDEIYAETPAVLARWLFSDICVTRIAPARFGDSSGVRGAAWLWREG